MEKSKEGKERILVTSALPYANGPLHVGHAIGAYIPADIYARYHRLKGNDIVFICGTDEHGTPISIAADKEGISPKEVVDKYHKIIVDAFEKLGIEFDNFSRTTKQLHYRTAQDFFLKILRKGLVYKKKVLRFYCENCRRFLADRYVNGTCPYCGSTGERGDQCESCGRQFDATELKNPKCAICNGTPREKETEHFYFKLSKFSDQLKDWIKKNEHWPENARNFSLKWISEGLEDRAITRDLSWGVPVPLEGMKDKVLYVWFEAPIGYISATKEWAEKISKPDEWKKYWLEDEGKETKIVHFIGKDNIPFHAVIWPAILMAYSGYNLPWQIASNEYLTLEGRKMSTSRNWVLWLHDALNNFDVDAVRYYLISINPERHDADFSLQEMQSRVNEELISTLGNFINRVLTLIKQKREFKVPKPEKFDEIDEEMLEMMKIYTEKIGKEIENFRFLQALNSLMEFAKHGNRYLQKKEPWKEKNETTLYVSVNLVRCLSILMYPFLPFSSEKTWRMLNLKGMVKEQKWDSASEIAIANGHEISRDIEQLFRKIHDDEIKKFKERYLSISEKPENIEKKKVKDNTKQLIAFSEFEKIDIRIGKIKKVEEHPRANNLYVLKVDLGNLGERTIVAGIKNYKKEELLGKNIVIVVNLMPKEIKGVISEGMLLAADLNNKPILLLTEKEVDPGCKVR